MARPQPQPTKAKAHKASDDLQVERLHQGYAQSMEITKVLADEQSRFQHIRIFDTVANGRVTGAGTPLSGTIAGTPGTGSAFPVGSSVGTTKSCTVTFKARAFIARGGRNVYSDYASHEATVAR